MESHFSKTLACIVALGLGVAAQTPAPPPQDRARADSATRRVTDRLRALQQEADALASQEKTLLVELRTLEVERQIKVEQLAQIDRDVRQNRQKLAETTARAAALRKTADTERPDAEARLVHLYKLGRAGYWRLLLDVDDVRSMGRAYRTASALTRIDRDRIQQHQRTLESLAREQKELEGRATEMTRLQGEALRARAAIERTVAARSALVESIDAQRDLNAQLIGELQSAQQRLQSSVAQLDSGASSVTLPLGAFRGALPWPVRGTVATRFGRQPGGRFGAVVLRNGIEIAGPEGQPVRAVHEGTVAFADQFTGYGNLVIVDHGDRAYSLYGYLNELQVSQEERVDAQAQLGLSGVNPAGAPALYFELRIDGKAVDPLQWLKRQ
jgi:septal ring factor EnvC (AmiA/AmiB activator)